MDRLSAHELRPSVTERRFGAAAHVFAYAVPIGFALVFVFLDVRAGFAAAVMWGVGYSHAAASSLYYGYRKQRNELEAER